MFKCDSADTHFFMEVLFVTKKSLKSNMFNTFCQFFVKNKFFIHEEPLRKKSYLICALKSFSKEVRVPEEIIADGSSEENSTEVKKFFN